MNIKAWSLRVFRARPKNSHPLSPDISSVKMFFAINHALMDASVWTWGVKRAYD